MCEGCTGACPRLWCLFIKSHTDSMDSTVMATRMTRPTREGVRRGEEGGEEGGEPTYDIVAPKMEQRSGR